MLNLDVIINFSEIVICEDDRIYANAYIKIIDDWSGSELHLMVYDVEAEDRTNNPIWNFSEFVYRINNSLEKLGYEPYIDVIEEEIEIDNVCLYNEIYEEELIENIEEITNLFN